MGPRRIGALIFAAVAASALLLAHPAGPAAAHPGPLPLPGTVQIDVDIGAPTGPLPRLSGVVAGSTDPDVDQLAPLRPRFVRLDAAIDELYDCSTGHLDPGRLSALQRRVDLVAAAGAEAFVSFDYMPPCLAMPGGLGLFGPTRRPPADPSAWQAAVAELLHALVSDRLAAGAAPVRYYETWNEPDWFAFYDGTLSQFVHGIFLPEARAVAAEEAAGGVDLRFGGCSCLFADDAWIGTLLSAAAGAGLSMDFVSWHIYANFPFLGPDGLEPLVGSEFLALYRLLGHANPFASPATYERQARRYRSRYPGLELLVTEWNLSSGGFDLRNDTHEGAAFVAASLIAMQRGGVDGATLYRLSDAWTHDAEGNPLPSRHGDWGLIDLDGAAKPSWYALADRARLGGEAVAVRAPDPSRIGVWTSAAHDPVAGRSTLLMASFQAIWAHGHEIVLTLHGLAPGTHSLRLHRIDAAHSGAEPAGVSTVDVGADGTARISYALPPQGVAFAEIDPA